MTRSVERREVSILLGVIVEKRPSSHPWADWIWKPVAVFMDDSVEVSWHELRREGERVQFHAATLPLTLHRTETEALRQNLMLPEPELYVVLREAEEGEADFPYEVHLVTASSFDIQDLEDAGDDIIEKVAMPEPVAAFIQAFVEEHHEDEVFIKRKRDRIRPEDQKFGKTPIFKSETKH